MNDLVELYILIAAGIIVFISGFYTGYCSKKEKDTDSDILDLTLMVEGKPVQITKKKGKS